jgi:predicted O-methyltransferase YrrM
MKYHEIPGWFNGYEQYDKAVDYCPPNGKILEIGCFYGKSTNYMCTNIVNTKRNDIKVYALDTFRGSSEHGFIKEAVGPDGTFKAYTEANLKEFIDQGIVELIESRSDNSEVINRFEDGFFDVIIVDGAHEYDAVLDDIENWWSKLKKDGIMLFDDMYMESVAQAVAKGLKDRVPNYSVMQGREAYGIAYNGEDQSKAKKYWKVIPEDHFK